MEQKIGLQIGSLHKIANEANLKDCMEKISSIGYDGIEIIYGGQFDFLHIKNRDPSFIKSIFEDTNIDLISSHVDYEELESNLEEVLEYHRNLDCNRLIVPRTKEDDFENETKISNLANKMKGLSAKLAEAGFDLAFHNCYFQTSLNNTEKLKLFDEKTEEKVTLQLDSGNAEIMGIDGNAILRSSPYNFETLHVKDGKKGENRSYSLGNGDVNLSDFVKISREREVPWIIVEDEDAEKPIKAIENDYKHLKNLS